MTSDSSKLYRTLWRWHFYAGLFCIPFVLSLSVTGAIYLFKPQIEHWTDRAYYNLNTNNLHISNLNTDKLNTGNLHASNSEILGQQASPKEHIQAAKNYLSGAKFASYRLPESLHQAIVITLQYAGERHLVYVHPDTLKVLKHIPFDSQFIRIVRSLHGELLLGNVGSIVIELAGSWAIVLIVTGLYLWWPRSSQGMAGVVYPRIRQRGRKFWRDLHAVTGFWVAIFTLFLLVSGLPWALVWGTAFKEIRSIGKPAVSQDWTIRHESQPDSNTNISGTLTKKLLKKAQALELAAPVELAPDRHQKNLWKLSSGHQNRMLRANAWFNRNGELIKVEDFSDKPTVDKVIGIGISAHEGHLFGWVNQFLGLLVTLGLILVSISGFILWRKRKPEATLGAPQALPNNRVGQIIFYTTLVLSILLPVLAVSLLIMLIIEKGFLSQLPRTRAWLGIR